MPAIDIPFFGNLALCLILVSAAYTFAMALGAQRGRPHLLVAARYGTYATAALVVEVADFTLALDRTTKRALYARNGTPEYWLVDLKDNCLELYREPREGRYRFQAILRHGDSVRPQVRPEHPIAVVDLLP